MTRVVAIVGPTASGKTALSIALAGQLGAEIVNADASQVYRGMDIGTAKPSVAERQGIPHHLIDTLDPDEEASVAAFQRDARAAVEGILARGVGVVLVGGSGLYVRAILDDLEFPGTDPAVRGELEAELARVGAPALHQRLVGLDPAAAAALLPTNGRRIVRALEVIRLTGQPFTATLPPYGAPRWDTVQLGLDPPLDVLDARIAARVEAMWADGLVAEVARLATVPPLLGRTAGRSLGYRQVLEMFAGDLTEAQAREATVAATRKFARRQRSWFRRDPRVRWLPWHDDPEATTAAALLQL